RGEGAILDKMIRELELQGDEERDLAIQLLAVTGGGDVERKQAAVVVAERDLRERGQSIGFGGGAAQGAEESAAFGGRRAGELARVVRGDAREQSGRAFDLFFRPEFGEGGEVCGQGNRGKRRRLRGAGRRGG